MTVVGSDDSALELAGTAVGWDSAGTGAESSLPQAAKAPAAISMNTPSNTLWDCSNIDRFLIQLYKPVPPKILVSVSVDLRAYDSQIPLIYTKDWFH